VQEKNGEKFVEKVQKHVFYIRTNIVTKNEKKRAKQFSRNTRKVGPKNVGKKSSVNVRKNLVYI